MDALRPAVERALDEIRPSLQADGGDVELVSVEAGVVKVRLLGTCTTCPGTAMTMTMTVEPMLKERVPGVRQVLAV